MNQITKQRALLILIATLFLLPFLVAVAMRFGGWEPPTTRNHGELLQPPLPMDEVTAIRADGTPWVFENRDRQWSLLTRAPTECADACIEQLVLMARVHEALGRHAPKLTMFVLDPAQAPSGGMQPLHLSGSLPAPMQKPLVAPSPDVWLVDPHGYLVMYYPPDFDPSGLRRDLARLVR